MSISIGMSPSCSSLINIDGEKDTIILCHGMSDSPKAIEEWAERFENNGFAVICPLLEGHGESITAFKRTTASQWLQSVKGALKFCANHQQTPVHLVGVSLGSLLCLLAAGLRPSQVKSLSMLAPAFRIKPLYLHYLLSVLRYFPEFILNRLPLFPKRKTGKFCLYSINGTLPVYSLGALARLYQIMKSCRKVRLTVPTLCVLDPDDEFVDFTATCGSLASKQGIHFVPLKGASHNITGGRRESEAFETVLEFVNLHS